MEKRPPNFLTILFGVTPPIRCYPILRYYVSVPVRDVQRNAVVFNALLGIRNGFNADPDPAW